VSALSVWREELARGERTTLTFDALWEVACREAAEAEMEETREISRRYVARLRQPVQLRAPRKSRGKWAVMLEWMSTSEAQ
jgi:hypothetical protein